MNPQKQLIQHDPDNNLWGDCYRTCVAVILGMEAKDVPHFCDLSEGNDNDRNGISGLRSWLKPQGYGVWQNIYPEEISFAHMMQSTAHLSPEVPIIITGMGKRGVNHCVVAMNGKVVCDPFTGKPDREPFSGPAYTPETGDIFWWIEVIAKLPTPPTKDTDQ